MTRIKARKDDIVKSSREGFACCRTPIATQEIVSTEFHDDRLRPVFQNFWQMLNHVARFHAGSPQFTTGTLTNSCK